MQTLGSMEGLAAHCGMRLNRLKKGSVAYGSNLNLSAPLAKGSNPVPLCQDEATTDKSQKSTEKP
jgi:hypothetical protein